MGNIILTVLEIILALIGLAVVLIAGFFLLLGYLQTKIAEEEFKNK